jgi:DNA-binding transcriptional LysR family regulator
MDQFDLNLLPVLDALWRHRHLGRAAQELGLSQPALSHALKRLREQLGDALFVKTPSGMEPSARAVELAPVVQSLLSTVHERVLVRQEFDAYASSRTFTLAMSDLGEMSFLPTLMAHLTTLAPAVDIVTVSMPPRELTGALQRSSVDLAIGYFPDLDGADVYQRADRKPNARPGRALPARQRHSAQAAAALSALPGRAAGDCGDAARRHRERGHRRRALGEPATRGAGSPVPPPPLRRQAALAPQPA